MHIEFQSHGKPADCPAKGGDDEVFSRVKNPKSLSLRYRPEVRREVFEKKAGKIIFAISIATVVAVATQATAKVFVF